MKSSEKSSLLKHQTHHTLPWSGSRLGWLGRCRVGAAAGVGGLAGLGLLALAWVCNIVVLVGAVGGLHDSETLLRSDLLRVSGPIDEDTLDVCVSVVECFQSPHSVVEGFSCFSKSSLCVWVRTCEAMVLEEGPAVRCDSPGDLSSSDDLILFNTLPRVKRVVDLSDATIADVPLVGEAAEVILLLKRESSAKTAHHEVSDLPVEVLWLLGLNRLHRYNY